MDTLYEVEKGIIVIVALLMAYAEFKQALRYRRSWVKWGLAVMGVYWAVYYSYSFETNMCLEILWSGKDGTEEFTGAQTMSFAYVT